MQPTDFFIEEEKLSALGWDSITERTFREDFLKQVRQRPSAEHPDLDVAVGLNRLVHSEWMKAGTGGGMELTGDQIELSQKTLKSVLQRLGVVLDLPWRNYDDFKTYWIQKGCYGSWQARRDLLGEYFDPVFEELDRLEETQDAGNLVEAVSPHETLGWPMVDEELRTLRFHFRRAKDAADHRDVGNRSVALLEALSRTLYVEDKHRRAGESVPSVDKTEARLGRYVEDSLAGKDHEAVRGVVKKATVLAHKVKHNPTSTRREAGIAADSAIMLAHLLRRVDQDL
ncbi:hypothetical protein [Nesterenkonia sp. Act20]|uniref:hypothetical protein n=1 Tax=Nesterenkonia sp. Act20 TaxID=1483432 RepID=UPI001C4682EE|nr:hypothetical protein [Nesterenkonia sp. Act20]